MNQSRHKTVNGAGFTMVEVLIVLAIAGLILLIVFLAIPALARSGRNNQRRQDVSIILETISHWELNNSGDLPLNTAALQNLLQNSPQHLTYYLPSQVFLCPAPTPPNPNYCKATNQNVTYLNTTDTNTVDIYHYSRCEPGPVQPFQGTNAGAGYSNVAALYALESGDPNSPVFQCEASS